MIKNIPNIFTGANLAMGILAVYLNFNYPLHYAAILILAASVFDFFDGFLARLLKAQSEFGKQFDSLADLISFGIVPGIICYRMLQASELQVLIGNINLIPFIAVIIPLFSAIRLAKFNIDTRQKHSFLGLPTPANALYWASLPLIIQYQEQHSEITKHLLSPAGIVVACILLSVFMISEIKLIALKFKGFSLHQNLEKYSFILLTVISLIWLGIAAMPFIVFLYLLISMVFYKKTE